MLKQFEKNIFCFFSPMSALMSACKGERVCAAEQPKENEHAAPSKIGKGWNYFL
jgi:hypothetical protein